MASRKYIGSSSRMPKSEFSEYVHLYICGEPFALDKKLLTSRSAKLAELLKDNPQEDISHLLRDIPADPKTFELVARFCHGFEVNISTDNVIRLSCLADYLGMTENHSPNNLLENTITFLGEEVIPCWNKSIRALKTAENILEQAINLGLVDALADSVITKVLENPQLLGEPIKNLTSDDDNEVNENLYRPNARRKLFDLDWKPEDLTILSVPLYEPIIHAMIEQVPSEYISTSLFQYVRRWVFSSSIENDGKSFDKKNSQREAIEAVERLLPHERGLLPCNLLFEMLRLAINLEAGPDCKNGFEVRIGKQLDQAMVKDLFIPCLGYAKEEQYDTESVRRILKHFYCNYSSSDNSAIIKVAELVENFLAGIASDRDLRTSTFIALADMAFAASVETKITSDGIYRAISIYLDKHTYLTESEKEEVCRILDFSKMSREACEHAATNRQLPLRVVVQVMFVHQLQLRDTLVAKEARCSEEEVASEEGVRAEMEKMSCKVTDLERECLIMKNEIRGGFCGRGKKEKDGVWREMKRKFGCITTMHNDCNCHVKKKRIHLR